MAKHIIFPGAASGLSNHSLHGTWANMIYRCYNPKHSSYPNYGAKGVRVCRKWRISFPAFLHDMGKKPTPLHTLDRIKNEGDYTPKNCRWATSEEQYNNMSSNVQFAYKGEVLTFAQWSRRTGISTSTIRDRFYAGWSIKRVLTQQIRERNRK